MEESIKNYSWTLEFKHFFVINLYNLFSSREYCYRQWNSLYQMFLIDLHFEYLYIKKLWIETNYE